MIFFISSDLYAHIWSSVSTGYSLKAASTSLANCYRSKRSRSKRRRLFATHASTDVLPDDLGHMGLYPDRTASPPFQEVVQLYLTTPNATVPTPQLRLAAFARVGPLMPGERRAVHLSVAPRWHAVVRSDASASGPDPDAVYAASATQYVEAGPVELMVGASSADVRLRGRVVVARTAALSTCPGEVA